MPTPTPTSDSISLAFASFHIVPCGNATISTAEFADSVKEFLSGLPEVSELRVSVAPYFDGEIDLNRLDAQIDLDRPMLGPHRTRVAGLAVDFTLEIRPLATCHSAIEQANVARVDSDTHVFRVHTRYMFGLPVVAIATIGSQAGSDPTGHATRVIDFLRRAADNNDNVQLRDDAAAPIYAHADFFLGRDQPPAKSDSPFWLREYKRSGYHHYYCSFDAAAFATDAEAVEEFVETVSTEVALYFLLNYHRHWRIDTWTDVCDRIDELIDQNSSGFKSALLRIHPSNVRAQDGFDLLFGLRDGELRFERELWECGFTEDLQDRYGEQPIKWVAELIDEARRDPWHFPVQQAVDLLHSLDAKQTRALTTGLTFAATGLLAGVVGGMLVTLAGIRK
jgi:hypothetical protein